MSNENTGLTGPFHFTIPSDLYSIVPLMDTCIEIDRNQAI